MASGAGAIRAWFGEYNFAFLAGGGIAMIAACMALQIHPRHQETSASPAAGRAAST